MVKNSVQRIDWIDSAKGIGIICVIIAHISAGYFVDHLIYSFHMPLFFFIGGYLLKPTSDIKDYFRKKVVHLLIPYFVFLTLLYIPQQILEKQNLPLIEYITKYLYGGTRLFGWVGVFWFTTCFFFAQQIMMILITQLKDKVIFILMILSLTLAYLNSALFPEKTLPLTLTHTLYAIPIFYIGYMFKKHNLLECLSKFNILIIFLAILAGVAVYFMPNLSIEMKFIDYGFPVVSLIINIILIYFIIIISKFISNKSNLLSYIGQASMIIMYMHQTIQLYISRYSTDFFVRFFPALLIPLLAYFIFNKFAIFRIFFLGSYNDLKYTYESIKNKIHYSVTRKERTFALSFLVTE